MHHVVNRKIQLTEERSLNLLKCEKMFLIKVFYLGFNNISFKPKLITVLFTF